MIPRAISGDGRVVVGYGANQSVGLVWTIDEGLEVVPSQFNTGGTSIVNATNVDGSIVVGVCRGAGQVGFRWNRSTNAFNLLQGLSGQRNITSASGLTDDGTVIIGDTRSGSARAGMWREGLGVSLFPDVNGHPAITANGLSADGSVVVGKLDDGLAFLWSADLGAFHVNVPAGLARAGGLAVTAIGDATFGYASSANPGSSVAFTWNPDTGPTEIPSIDGFNVTMLTAASDDGRIAVGLVNERVADPTSNQYAAVFTIGVGTTTLSEHLALFGHSSLPSDFIKATDISDAGNVIMGEGGVHPYWVVIVPPPQLSDFNVDRFVDFQDLTDFLDCFEGNSMLPVSSADLNRDGFTDFFDIIEFFDHF